MPRLHAAVGQACQRHNNLTTGKFVAFLPCSNLLHRTMRRVRNRSSDLDSMRSSADLAAVVATTLESRLATEQDPRVSKDRHPAALERLRKYSGRAPGREPITELARARMEERFAVPGLTGPWSLEVEQSLKNQPRFVAGIRELFEKSDLQGWEKDLALLETQLDAHAKWLRAELLPRAPPEPAAPDRQHWRARRVHPAAREPECGAGFVDGRLQVRRDHVDANGA